MKINVHSGQCPLELISTKGGSVNFQKAFFFNSPKKRTKISAPLGQKLTFSSLFFGRIEDTKIFSRLTDL